MNIGKKLRFLYLLCLCFSLVGELAYCYYYDYKTILDSLIIVVIIMLLLILGIYKSSIGRYIGLLIVVVALFERYYYFSTYSSNWLHFEFTNSLCFMIAQSVHKFGIYLPVGSPLRWIASGIFLFRNLTYLGWIAAFFNQRFYDFFFE